MLSVRWKRDMDKPGRALLKRAQATTTVADDGTLSFGDIDVRLQVHALASFVERPEGSSRQEWPMTVQLSVFAALKSKPSDIAAAFLQQLNRRARADEGQRRRRFRVVTRLTVQPHRSIKARTIGPCTIRFAESTSDARRWAEAASVLGLDARASAPPRSTWLEIHTRARTAASAFEIAAENLDLLRAVWSMAYGPKYRESFGGRPAPAGPVASGPMFLVLGRKHSDRSVFYEPFYAPPRQALALRNVAHLRTFERSVLRRLVSHPFEGRLRRTLIRYVRALDDADHSTAILKMWAALEEITGTTGGRYSETIRRASFLYAETETQGAMLEYGRQRRNAIAHSATGLQAADEGALFFLRRCVEHLVRNALAMGRQLGSDSAFFDLLDMPVTPKDLTDKIARLRRSLATARCADKLRMR